MRAVVVSLTLLVALASSATEAWGDGAAHEVAVDYVDLIFRELGGGDVNAVARAANDLGMGPKASPTFPFLRRRDGLTHSLSFHADGRRVYVSGLGGSSVPLSRTELVTHVERALQENWGLPDLEDGARGTLTTAATLIRGELSTWKAAVSSAARRINGNRATSDSTTAGLLVEVKAAVKRRRDPRSNRRLARSLVALVFQENARAVPDRQRSIRLLRHGTHDTSLGVAFEVDGKSVRLVDQSEWISPGTAPEGKMSRTELELFVEQKLNESWGVPDQDGGPNGTLAGLRSDIRRQVVLKPRTGSRLSRATRWLHTVAGRRTAAARAALHKAGSKVPAFRGRAAKGRPSAR